MEFVLHRYHDADSILHGLHDLRQKLSADRLSVSQIKENDFHLFWDACFITYNDNYGLAWNKFIKKYGVDFVDNDILRVRHRTTSTPKSYYVRKLPSVDERKRLLIRQLVHKWAIGCPINSSYAQNNLTDIYGKACHYFGSWSAFIEAAGFDYSSVRVNPIRGKQYYVDYLAGVYNRNGKVEWSDIKNMNGAMRYFDGYHEWFKRSGVPYKSAPSQIKQWSSFGLRFERIVKIIFDELFPLYIYQFRGVNGIRPDWYDAETRTVYDAKLSLHTVDDWRELDTYTDEFDKIVVVYMVDSESYTRRSNIEYRHVSSYFSQLSESTLVRVKRMLLTLQYDVNNVWDSDESVKIWELHHGKIPNGYHLHHVDGDKYNNQLSNLTLIDDKTQHLYRIGCYVDDNGQWVKRCSRCNQVKLYAAEFYKSRPSWCKQCYIDGAYESLRRKRESTEFTPGGRVRIRVGSSYSYGTFLCKVEIGDTIPDTVKVLGGKVSDSVRYYVQHDDGRYFVPKAETIWHVSKNK